MLSCFVYLFIGNAGAGIYYWAVAECCDIFAVGSLLLLQYITRAAAVSDSSSVVGRTPCKPWIAARDNLRYYLSTDVYELYVVLSGLH